MRTSGLSVGEHVGKVRSIRGVGGGGACKHVDTYNCKSIKLAKTYSQG